MKALTITMRVLLGLILLMPVLGALGVFPAPTASMYTPQAWAFMKPLMDTGYMMPLIGLTCAAALVLLVTSRTALMAVVLVPLTVNVMLFHIVLEHEPLASTIFGVLLLVLNIFFLWTERSKYQALFAPTCVLKK
jgi:putative oxidoreductase